MSAIAVGVAGIGAAGAIGGGLLANQAQSDASDAAIEQTQTGVNAEIAMFNKNLQLNKLSRQQFEPFYNAGVNKLQLLTSPQGLLPWGDKENKYLPAMENLILGNGGGGQMYAGGMQQQTGGLGQISHQQPWGFDPTSQAKGVMQQLGGLSPNINAGGTAEARSAMGGLGAINPNLSQGLNPTLAQSQGLNPYLNASPTAGTKSIMEQLSKLSSTKPSGVFNPNDPTYKFKQQQQEEGINKYLASRGLYNSRPGVNQLAESNQALIADESQLQYGRSQDAYAQQYGALVDQYNMASQTAGLDYQKSADDYNRQYQLSSDDYNRQYQLATGDYARQYGQGIDQYNQATQQGGIDYQQGQDQYARQYGQLADQYTRAIQTGQIDQQTAIQDYDRKLAGLSMLHGTQANLGSAEYQRAMDLIKISQNAAGSVGNINAMQGAQGTALGQGINAGAINAANVSLAQGQNNANMWSGLGAMPTNFMNAYNMSGGGFGAPAQTYPMLSSMGPGYGAGLSGVGQSAGYK